MKKLRLILMAGLAVTFLFAVSQCSEDDPVTLYSISGKVTYPDFNGATADAAGAVIYLAQGTEATTAYEWATIADGSGNYTFKDLQPGDYWMWAVYDTKNTNVPEARVDRAIFTGEGATMTLSANATQNVALTSLGQDDAMTVNTMDGGDWGSDISHSNVDFEFPYDKQEGEDAYNATYTGRLTGFDIGVKFDPNDLGSSSITAEVDMLSVNTSSPGGRDPLWTTDANDDVVLWQDVDGNYDLGCISGYYAIDSPDDPDRTATFTSSSIEEYADGYVAKGTMKFAGNEGTVNLFFKFLPGFQAPNRQQVLTQYSSFEGFFDFAAKDVFGVESSHVQDADVTVRISYQVTKALE